MQGCSVPSFLHTKKNKSADKEEEGRVQPNTPRCRRSLPRFPAQIGNTFRQKRTWEEFDCHAVGSMCWEKGGFGVGHWETLAAILLPWHIWSSHKQPSCQKPWPAHRWSSGYQIQLESQHSTKPCPFLLLCWLQAVGWKLRWLELEDQGTLAAILLPWCNGSVSWVASHSKTLSSSLEKFWIPKQVGESAFHKAVLHSPAFPARRVMMDIKASWRVNIPQSRPQLSCCDGQKGDDVGHPWVAVLTTKLGTRIRAGKKNEKRNRNLMKDLCIYVGRETSMTWSVKWRRRPMKNLAGDRTSLLTCSESVSISFHWTVLAATNAQDFLCMQENDITSFQAADMLNWTS